MAHPLPDVFSRHPELPCLQHAAVRTAMETMHFTVEASGPHPNLAELLGIWGVRSKHLASVPGELAERLRQSVLAFCAALMGPETHRNKGSNPIQNRNKRCQESGSRPTQRGRHRVTRFIGDVSPEIGAGCAT